MSTRKPGFTLLELLIVVVVVGILATAGLVNWAKARQQALDNDAKANLRVLDLKAREYQVDHGGYPTSINQVRPVRPDGTTGAPPVPPKDDRVSHWAYAYAAMNLGGGAWTIWPVPTAVLKRADGSLTTGPTRILSMSQDGTFTISQGSVSDDFFNDEP